MFDNHLDPGEILPLGIDKMHFWVTDCVCCRYNLGEFRLFRCRNRNRIRLKGINKNISSLK